MEKLNRFINKYGLVAGLVVMLVGILVSSERHSTATGIAITISGVGLLLARR